MSVRRREPRGPCSSHFVHMSTDTRQWHEGTRDGDARRRRLEIRTDRKRKPVRRERVSNTFQVCARATCVTRERFTRIQTVHTRVSLGARSPARAQGRRRAAARPRASRKMYIPAHAPRLPRLTPTCKPARVHTRWAASSPPAWLISIHWRMPPARPVRSILQYAERRRRVSAECCLGGRTAGREPLGLGLVGRPPDGTQHRRELHPRNERKRVAVAKDV